MKNIAYISLGSNIHDRSTYINEAISLLSKNKNIKIKKQSSIIRTDPIGYEDQEYFLNLIIIIETKLNSFDLLQCLKDSEKLLGRKKRFRWGPREIDLDIIFFNNEVIETKELTIPHKETLNRQFIIDLCCEIDANHTHPLTKKVMSTYLQ